MRVMIVMVMQTTLTDLLHVLLKPSIGFGLRVPPVAIGHLNYLYLLVLYCKKHDTGGCHIGHKPMGLSGYIVSDRLSSAGQ